MAAIADRIAVLPLAREGVRAEAGHIAAIDGVRGLAVLWVMVFHYVVVRDGRFTDPFIAALDAIHPLNVIARNGYLGVDLFFVISGFLLAIPWFTRAQIAAPAPSLRAFYARRFWRIAPAYYVQLAILFLLVLPLIKGIAYWRSDLYVIAFNAVAHVGFLHNTTPLTSGSLAINGALWTLAVEAQYYLLLPLIAPLFVRAPWLSLAAAIAIAIAWQLGARHGLDGLVAAQRSLGTPWGWSEATVRQLLLTQLPSYLVHFAVGILAGRAWVRWRTQRPSSRCRSAWRVAAVLGLGALYAVYGHLGPFLGDVTWLIAPLALGASFFALAANDRGIGGALLGRGPLAFLGRISYSAYLYHLLVLVLWNDFAPALGWASLPGYLALVLALSWLSWRFVETPFMRARAPAIRRPARPRLP
jgi:peptidoglycan/LPS O-acetylase OafA/YrhL